jgi:hypothetical protein
MTEQNRKEKNFPLSSEDKARMARLFEEVESRLQEMGRIAARTANLDAAAKYQVKFLPRQQESNPDSGGGSGPGGVDIEIICDQHGCICYDYREGICIPC